MSASSQGAIPAAPGPHCRPLHDPLAVGLAVDASLARWQPVRIVVGENGQTRRAAGTPNCRVAHAIDVERFLELFFDRLCPASAQSPTT